MEFKNELSIVLKNMTSEIIKNVNVFDYEDNNRDKIKYLTTNAELSYQEILKELTQLGSPKQMIDSINIKVGSNLDHWRDRQVHSIITAHHTNKLGYVTKTELALYKPFKLEKKDIEFEFEDTNLIVLRKMQIELQHLMPMTKVTLTLKFKKIS